MSTKLTHAFLVTTLVVFTSASAQGQSEPTDDAAKPPADSTSAPEAAPPSEGSGEATSGDDSTADVTIDPNSVEGDAGPDAASGDGEGDANGEGDAPDEGDANESSAVETDVVEAQTVPAEAPSAEAPSEEEPPAAPSEFVIWASEHRLSVGGEAGVLWTPGRRLGRELDSGFLIHAFAQADLLPVPYTRAELTLGFSRQGRPVKARVGSLWRVPLTLSAIGLLPMSKLLGDEATDLPTPYARLGLGGALALLGRGSKTRLSEGSFDPTIQWGVGLEYPVDDIFEIKGLTSRLEFTHTVQFEKKTGHFFGITLGAHFRSEFDQDGDGIVDSRDQCPTVREDPDGFADEDGCPDPDNDGDGLLDDDDACPDEPEDFDGFKDDDGCPDLDNDRDLILDENDKCPMEAEDRDGFEDDDGCPDLDNDDDTIPDVRDACPLEPEDFDGFKDADGCPDPDNDGDGFLDKDDACPMKPEDFNGYKDDDGCPDAKDDKDGDGIIDREDKCPTQPEDRDGFQDEDGCPDPDNDEDGVLDAVDACPLEAEDRDGFMDEDGCPELDNDGDGIADIYDKCPNEAEVINGIDDDDGCPDEGAQLVKLTSDKIEIKEKVYFNTSSAVIQGRSHNLLNQVATLLENHADLAIRVEGHTDDTGSEVFNLKLSQRRAESVRQYLIEQGVAAERLEAVGYGEERSIASNRSRAGREMNRRVEFVIVEQGGSEGP